MRTVILKLIVATCVFAIVAQAQTRFLQQDHSTGTKQVSRAYSDQSLATKAGENDFLLPGQGFPSGKGITNSGVQSSLTSNIVSSGIPVESIVQYQSFSFGTIFTLHAFSGKYVSYLLPESQIGVNGLSRDEIRELVDLTDMMYANMREIVGGEPSGEGLLTIAMINPGYDFGAKGWVGKKGVEMYQGYGVRYKNDFLAGCVPNPVVHEMTHNFDLYNAYISHDGNNVHAWTGFLIPYAQYYSQAGASWHGNVVSPRTLLDQAVDIDMDPWDTAGTTVSWDACVKTGSGCADREIYANVTWAGIFLRYARLHGAAAVKQSLRYVSAYKAAHATPPATAEAKNDVLVSAFAAGAEANVACEVISWNWPVSAEAEAQMAITFPNQNPFCSDVDNDTYSPARGDHNDTNSAIRPDAVEMLNGLDDDCDANVDDVLFREVDDVSADVNAAQHVSIPGHIIGHTATADDSDSYQIQIDTPRSLNILAKGMGKSFTGWFELRYAADPDTTAPIYLPYEIAGATVIQFDRAGTWILTVRPWAGAGEGYELFLGKIDEVLAPQLQIIAPSKLDTILVSVTIDQDSFKGSTPTSARLWVEGIGFVAEQSFRSVMTFKLKLPNTYNIRLRTQLFIGDSPFSNATRSVSTGIRYKAFPNPPAGQTSPIAVAPKVVSEPLLKTNALPEGSITAGTRSRLIAIRASIRKLKLD
jgi:hypothetical protein